MSTLAKADGSYVRELSRIEKQDLFILDDFGIQPFDAQGRASFYHKLLDYKTSPDKRKAKKLEKEFERIFTTQTPYFQLS